MSKELIKNIEKKNHIPNKCTLFEGKTCLGQPGAIDANGVLTMKNYCKDCRIYIAAHMVSPIRRGNLNYA